MEPKNQREKCETILIRLPIDCLNKNEKLNWRDFEVRIQQNNDSIAVPHKQCVKYLGMQIDHLLRLNKYLDVQLIKARKAFRSLAKLFYNKYLEPKAKVICYCLLVRPILSYTLALCGTIRVPPPWKESALSKEHACEHASANTVRPAPILRKW